MALFKIKLEPKDRSKFRKDDMGNLVRISCYETSQTLILKKTGDIKLRHPSDNAREWFSISVIDDVSLIDSKTGKTKRFPNNRRMSNWIRRKIKNKLSKGYEIIE